MTDPLDSESLDRTFIGMMKALREYGGSPAAGSDRIEAAFEQLKNLLANPLSEGSAVTPDGPAAPVPRSGPAASAWPEAARHPQVESSPHGQRIQALLQGNAELGRAISAAAGQNYARFVASAGMQQFMVTVGSQVSRAVADSAAVLHTRLAATATTPDDHQALNQLAQLQASAARTNDHLRGLSAAAAAGGAARPSGRVSAAHQRSPSAPQASAPFSPQPRSKGPAAASPKIRQGRTR
ncbi:hypothetical protein GCM10010156_66410 [Planobispora rosea]|uniref:Uncharacterized protein n=1 Tax=Planobispora rosea TaxID=35762 RepID=A0A8J3S716_PLARO|nr:hypothetical protein [Planobispora rosea]GGS98996.1 hypothetical protein GCM10010156_66410 [Planobispora rosea]GIH88004.1 hypothetical protein Pro02_64120 [Planobispora rosea]